MTHDATKFIRNDIRHFLSSNSILGSQNIEKDDNIEMEPIRNGCHKCKGCAICTMDNDQNTMFLIMGDYFIGAKTGYKYHINQSFNCDSTYIIYSLMCINCGIQSVGSTENFKTRFSSHKSDILHNKENGCNLVGHFNDKNSKCFVLRTMILDGIKNDNIKYRIADGRMNKLEIQWQGKLVTVHHGGNDTKDFNNSRWNRRNFSIKWEERNESIIILNRAKSNFSNKCKNWNKGWITLETQDKKHEEFKINNSI